MKLPTFIWIVFTCFNGFSQKIDSLVASYRIGYKCSPEIDGEEKRGVCGKWQELTYEKKKRNYQLKKFESKESFREWTGKWEVSQDSTTKEKIKNWVGGFGPNLLKDSISCPKLFRDKRVSVKTLDAFLLSIIAIKTDTVFPYVLKDAPASFLEKNSLDLESDKKEVDSLLQDEFSGINMSNVTGYFFLSFIHEGVSYDLCKDSNNMYWRLSVNKTEERNPFRFIHFAFDAFLLDVLPKKFFRITSF